MRRLIELLTLYGRLGSGSYALAFALTGDRASAEQVLIDAFSIALGTSVGMSAVVEQEVLSQSIVLACQRLNHGATRGNVANSPKPLRAAPTGFEPVPPP